MLTSDLQVVQRKEKELGSLSGKTEDEQSLGTKMNTQIKELQSRLEELDEELETERCARARADKVLFTVVDICTNVCHLHKYYEYWYALRYAGARKSSP